MMYGMNKKAYKPVSGGSKVQSSAMPRPGQNKEAIQNASQAVKANALKSAIKKIRGS